VYTLITAATSAKAHQLKNQLQSQNVFLGDYLDLPEVMVKTGKMLALPNPHKEAYPHQMLAFCLDNNISAVYILRSEEALALAPAGQLFREYDIEIVASYD
jgi:hypothetical protein